MRPGEAGGDDGGSRGVEVGSVTWTGVAPLTVSSKKAEFSADSAKLA